MIKNSSISPSQIKSDFNEYINTLDDKDKWLEFYQSSNNQLLLDTIAGFGTFLSYKYITNRNETYLKLAKLKESLKNIAISKGYKINRVQTPKLEVTYTGDDSIVLLKNSPIGYYKSLTSVVPEADIILEKGEKVNAILGEWVTISDTITNVSDIVSYSIKDSVDNNHINLYVNDILLELSKDLEDLLIENKATQFTNYNNSVEVTLKVKDNGLKLSSGDKIRIEYLRNLTNSRLTQSEINSIEYKDNFSLSSVLFYGSNEDDIEVIRYYASLFYSTLKRAVSKTDHDIIASTYQGVKSALLEKSKDCTGTIHYLLQEPDPDLTDIEKKLYENFILKYSVLSAVKVVKANHKILDLSFEVKLSYLSKKDIVEENINNIISLKLYQLNCFIDISELVSQIASLDNVVGVRDLLSSGNSIISSGDYKYFKLNSLNLTFTV